MATNIESELRSRVDAFAAELADLIRRSTLETLQAVLNGTTTPVRVTTRRKAGRKAAKATAAKAGAKAVRGSSGGRRTTDDLEATADAVLAHVQANPGARMEQIGKAVGAATKDLRRPVQMLTVAGTPRA